MLGRQKGFRRPWGAGAAGRGDGASARDLRGGTHRTWGRKGVHRPGLLST